MDKAVSRLGMLGLLSAAAHPLLHYGTRLVLPEEVLRVTPLPHGHLPAMWTAILAGLAIYALTRTPKLAPGLMLDIGLMFEVVGAFCIGLLEASHMSMGDSVYPEPGGIAVWITLFVLVVPNTLGKTALAALASAAMGPLTLIVAAYANEQPFPPPFVFLVNFAPTLVIAASAIILSRFVYSMGTRLSKAREVGSYRLVELLGRGGMGEVWRAEHHFLARPAAIKLIQPQLLGFTGSSETIAARQRFEREAQATAMLSSPHTINLYDFGVAEDGAFYYVMELLHGVDLETLVDKYGPLPAERVAQVLEQACSSLEEAHQSGLVHRDIKPANIFSCRYGLEFDFIKVLDFGLVNSTKVETRQPKLTQMGTTAGTPGFMAPEMAFGGEVDARADIYAIGCVGYWLLTGKLVFEEDSSIAMMMAHAQKTPIPPSRRTEIEVPAKLEELLMQCLEKLPESRPASAGEIRRRIVQHGLSESWTAERAEKWWKLHVPEKSAVKPSDVGETLQANAEI
jgi:eukaryotic-like serine/threonine-protein kinase